MNPGSYSDRIVIIGSDSSWSLEGSYERALKSLGIETTVIDVSRRIESKLPLAGVMQKLRVVLDDRKWVKEVNREIAIEILDLKPKAVIVFCNAEFIYSSLALLRTASDIKTVLIWPDTPFNLSPEISMSAPLYDLVCTYSNTTIDVFQRMGCRQVVWVPLAGDPELHGRTTEPSAFTHDISFIGNWRPEREEILKHIFNNFSDRRIRISGSGWKTHVRNTKLQEIINETLLLGDDYANFINQSAINLNIVDRTNYPAANMRFFEIPVAFGLQITSAVPEQAHVFRASEHCFYYADSKDLIEKIGYCLSHEAEMRIVRGQANAILLAHHTYSHRATQILKELL